MSSVRIWRSARGRESHLPCPYGGVNVKPDARRQVPPCVADPGRQRKENARIATHSTSTNQPPRPILPTRLLVARPPSGLEHLAVEHDVLTARVDL